MTTQETLTTPTARTLAKIAPSLHAHLMVDEKLIWVKAALDRDPELTETILKSQFDYMIANGKDVLASIVLNLRFLALDDLHTFKQLHEADWAAYKRIGLKKRTHTALTINRASLAAQIHEALPQMVMDRGSKLSFVFPVTKRLLAQTVIDAWIALGDAEEERRLIGLLLDWTKTGTEPALVVAEALRDALKQGIDWSKILRAHRLADALYQETGLGGEVARILAVAWARNVGHMSHVGKTLRIAETLRLPRPTIVDDPTYARTTRLETAAYEFVQRQATAVAVTMQAVDELTRKLTTDTCCHRSDLRVSFPESQLACITCFIRDKSHHVLKPEALDAFFTRSCAQLFSLAMSWAETKTACIAEITVECPHPDGDGIAHSKTLRV